MAIMRSILRALIIKPIQLCGSAAGMVARGGMRAVGMGMLVDDPSLSKAYAHDRLHAMVQKHTPLHRLWRRLSGEDVTNFPRNHDSLLSLFNENYTYPLTSVQLKQLQRRGAATLVTAATFLPLTYLSALYGPLVSGLCAALSMKIVDGLASHRGYINTPVVGDMLGNAGRLSIPMGSQLAPCPSLPNGNNARRSCQAIGVATITGIGSIVSAIPYYGVLPGVLLSVYTTVMTYGAFGLYVKYQFPRDGYMNSQAGDKFASFGAILYSTLLGGGKGAVIGQGVHAFAKHVTKDDDFSMIQILPIITGSLARAHNAMLQLREGKLPESIYRENSNSIAVTAKQVGTLSKALSVIGFGMTGIVVAGTLASTAGLAAAPLIVPMGIVMVPTLLVGAGAWVRAARTPTLELHSDIETPDALIRQSEAIQAYLTGMKKFTAKGLSCTVTMKRIKHTDSPKGLWLKFSDGQVIVIEHFILPIAMQRILATTLLAADHDKELPAEVRHALSPDFKKKEEGVTARTVTNQLAKAITQLVTPSVRREHTHPWEVVEIDTKSRSKTESARIIPREIESVLHFTLRNPLSQEYCIVELFPNLLTPENATDLSKVVQAAHEKSGRYAPWNLQLSYVKDPYMTTHSKRDNAHEGHVAAADTSALSPVSAGITSETKQTSGSWFPWIRSTPKSVSTTSIEATPPKEVVAIEHCQFKTNGYHYIKGPYVTYKPVDRSVHPQKATLYIEDNWGAIVEDYLKHVPDADAALLKAALCNATTKPTPTAVKQLVNTMTGQFIAYVSHKMHENPYALSPKIQEQLTHTFTMLGCSHTQLLKNCREIETPTITTFQQLQVIMKEVFGEFYAKAQSDYNKKVQDNHSEGRTAGLITPSARLPVTPAPITPPIAASTPKNLTFKPRTLAHTPPTPVSSVKQEDAGYQSDSSFASSRGSTPDITPAKGDYMSDTSGYHSSGGSRPSSRASSDTEMESMTATKSKKRKSMKKRNAEHKKSEGEQTPKKRGFFARLRHKKQAEVAPLPQEDMLYASPPVAITPDASGFWRRAVGERRSSISSELHSPGS